MESCNTSLAQSFALNLMSCFGTGKLSLVIAASLPWKEPVSFKFVPEAGLSFL